MRFLLLSVLLLGACSTEAVKLHNPQTGETVQCGPYGWGAGVGNQKNAVYQLRACVVDYQQQGYTRGQ